MSWAGEPSALAEEYVNTLYRPPQFPAGAPCARWWATQNLLVGGSIISPADGKHLAADFRVGVVLSVECERSDEGRWEEGRWEGAHCWAPFSDTGGDASEAMRKLLAFVRCHAYDYWPPGVAGPRYYVHCQMGGSRSPAAAYLVLRLSLSPSAALVCIQRGKPGYGQHPFHQAYLAAAEKALEECGR